MKYSIQILTGILLWWLFSCSFLEACKEKTAEVPEPIVTKNYLTFQLSSVNQLQLNKEGAYEYELRTTGEDPYVLLDEIPTANSEDKVVFTFEYKCTEDIGSLQFFFAPPISEEQSVKEGSLDISDKWKTFAVDLGDYINEFNWGAKGRFLRLDLGSKSGVTIYMKNMELRVRNAEEEALAKEREEARENDLLLEERLKKYLTEDFTASISEVIVLETKIVINGNIPENGDFNLCEVRPYEDLVQINKFQEGEVLNSQNFSVEIERFVSTRGFNYDRLLSKWVIVKKGTSTDEIVSHAHYADKIYSAQEMPSARLNGKKGLGGFAVNRGFTEDLDKLQISSVTVNISFTSFMYLQSRANTIAHTYGGQTYYFDKNYVNDLDQTMKKAMEKNITVAAIILVQKASECADSQIGELLQYPTYTTEGIFTMPDMTTSAGLNCYAAALDFLASRYNRQDNAYGRIHYWIMHNEVDAGITWTNMGEKPLAVYTDTYIKSMRLCCNIARKYNASSEVLASFTHSWTEPVEPRFYSTVDMLEFLLQSCAAEGDFQWGLAYHSYPEDLNEPKTWNDAKATFSMGTPLVTFKNLEVLDTWIKKAGNKFQGEIKRTLWLSENGANSRTYSETDLKEQAAGLAYAWKKIKVLDGIDAIQWHNWIDNRNEFGLRIGLRRFPDDESEPGGEKPVWYVYQAAGTEQEEAVFDEYKSVIGVRDWAEIFGDVTAP